MEFKKKRDQWQAEVAERVRKDPAFKKALFANPREVISKELGVELPKGMNVHVLEENLNDTYLVLPRPASSTSLSDDQLEAVAGGHAETCGEGVRAKHTDYDSGCFGTW